MGFPFLAWSGKLWGRIVLAILALMTFTTAILNWRIAVWVVGAWMAAAMIEVIRSLRMRAGAVAPHFTAKFWPLLAMLAVFTVTHSNTFGCNRYRVIVELPLALLAAVTWHHLVVRPGKEK